MYIIGEIVSVRIGGQWYDAEVLHTSSNRVAGRLARLGAPKE